MMFIKQNGLLDVALRAREKKSDSARLVPGALTSFVYDGENKIVKQTNPDGKVTTNTYSGSGLKRSYQEFGGTVHTMVWDGSDYLGEVTA